MHSLVDDFIVCAKRVSHPILGFHATEGEKYLGAALEEEKISPPAPLEGFLFPQFSKDPNSRFANHRFNYSPGYTPPEEDRQIVATRCRYKMRGKIIPHGTAGDATAVTMMTLGLGEIIMLPMAISEVRPDASIVNDFEVWYSTKGTVLAYHWAWRSEKEPSKKADPVSTDNDGAEPRGHAAEIDIHAITWFTALLQSTNPRTSISAA